MTVTAPSPNFRKLIKGALNQEVLVPLLRAYFDAPTFKTILLPIEGFDSRSPDGWFHPSEHPSWPARMLYYYLTEPGAMEREPPDPTFVLAVTQGKFWHALVQHILLEVGALRENPNPPSEHERSEFPFAHQLSKSRGHVDGITEPEKLPIDGPEVFEFKTMSATKLQSMPQAPPTDPVVLAWLIERCYDYFLQGQEYMRLSGFHRWRGLFMSFNPYLFREVVMDYDPAIGYAVQGNYQIAISASEAGTPPPNCCTPRSKESKVCPARQVCPVASL